MELTTTKECGGKHGRYLFYGDSGIGKTVLSATADQPILRWEVKGEGDAAASIAHLDIPTLKIDSYADFVVAYCATRGKHIAFGEHDPEIVPVDLDRDKVTELAKQIAKIKPATLVIDSWTSLADSVLLKHSYNVRGDKGKMNWGDLSKAHAFWLERVFGLEMNVVFLALTDRVEDEDTGRTMYRPGMPGQASLPVLLRAVTGYMYIFRGDKWGEPDRDRYIQLQTGKGRLCKLRVPPTIPLPQFIEADIQKLNALVERAKGATV